MRTIQSPDTPHRAAAARMIDMTLPLLAVVLGTATAVPGTTLGGADAVTGLAVGGGGGGMGARARRRRGPYGTIPATGAADPTAGRLGIAGLLTFPW